MVVNRVGPLSCAKIAGVLYALMGALVGVIVSLAAVAGAMGAAAGGDDRAFVGALFGVGAVVFLPIFYGVLGFLMTLLMAWLYNVVASMVGGIEVELQ